MRIERAAVLIVAALHVLLGGAVASAQDSAASQVISALDSGGPAVVQVMPGGFLSGNGVGQTGEATYLDLSACRLNGDGAFMCPPTVPPDNCPDTSAISCVLVSSFVPPPSDPGGPCEYALCNPTVGLGGNLDPATAGSLEDLLRKVAPLP